MPEVSVKNIEIDLTYLTNKVTPVGERKFNFTIMNGEKAEYDANNPLCDADYPDDISEKIDATVFEKLGVKKVASYIYNIIAQILRYFTKFMDSKGLKITL